MKNPTLRSSSLHTEAAGFVPPDAFGRFRVLHQIGAGTLGPVFRAYEPDRERLVAIKLFRLDLPPDRVHRLVEELDRLVALRLTHSTVAAPLAAGIQDSTPYLVQEFVSAESLDIVVRDYGRTPPVDTVGLALQLAEALDFAAGFGVLGGALHPRDVLVSADEARITGLGVVAALERVGVNAPVRRPFTAPERMAGRPWDRRADIYSLAAILHEVLWGRRIVGGGGQVADALTELPGANLDAVRAAFARALADEPANRFETALEFATALEGAFPGIESEPEPVFNQPVPIDVAAAPENTADAEITLPFDDLERYPQAEPSPAAVIATNPTLQPPAADTMGRLQSAIWPIALAILVGLAIGFAGGYAVGIRDRATPVTTPPAAATPTEQAPVAARDYTESAVPRSHPSLPPALPPAPAAGELGRLLVRSTPAGARVFVDGRDRGRTPAAVRELSAGAHRVRVVQEGYETEERRIVISASHRAQSVNLALAPTRPPPAATAAGSFFGSLSVDSRPIGASVFVDGRPMGQTPVLVAQIGAGDHVVRLEHQGYRGWSSSVRVVSGERNRVTASLER